MLIKLYESFGVLAHEKRPYYSEIVPASESYNVVTVDIPDDYPLSKNAMGETLIDINDVTYLLREVLNNYGDRPCLKWYDGQTKRYIILDIIKRQ